MHKKSIEAQQKVKPDDATQDMITADISRDRPTEDSVGNDVRSESIASLRAKAVEHCAKISQHDRRYSDQSIGRESDSSVEVNDIEVPSYNSVFKHPRKDKETSISVS